jgi:hypothetical protein
VALSPENNMNDLITEIEKINKQSAARITKILGLLLFIVEGLSGAHPLLPWRHARWKDLRKQESAARDEILGKYYKVESCSADGNWKVLLPLYSGHELSAADHENINRELSVLDRSYSDGIAHHVVLGGNNG